MAEKTTVAFRIDESVKQEWEEAAESPEYDSLSHLIRLAVQREITDSETTHTGAQAGAESNVSSEVVESLNRLERTVEDIQNEMEAVSQESQAEKLYDLEQVLLEILPAMEIDFTDNAPMRDADIETYTAEEAAARIGADEEDVSDALDNLVRNTAQVQRTEHLMGQDAEYFKSGK